MYSGSRVRNNKYTSLDQQPRISSNKKLLIIMLERLSNVRLTPFEKEKCDICLFLQRYQLENI